MKFNISNVFYRKCKANDQILTEISLGHDVHHFIPPNQCILLKSLLNVGNLKKVLWIKTCSNYGNVLRGILSYKRNCLARMTHRV